MSRVRVVRDWSQLESFSSHWNELVRASAKVGQSSIFQTYEWNASWWSVFGRNQELLVLVVSEGDVLLGIAPWMITREWVGPFRRKVIRFIGNNCSSDYCDFVSAPGDLRVVHASLKWLAENRKEWDRLDLDYLPTHSPNKLALESWFADHSLGYFSEFAIDAPTRLLGNPEQDQAVLNKKSLKRHFNYFQKNGVLTFSHFESREEILGQLDGLFAQHIERRALASDSSQFLFESQREFYRVISRNLPLDWLRLSQVCFDGVSIAYHLGFEFEGKYIWYKPTFNVKFQKHSPGEVLLRFLLDYAIGKGLAELDFTVGQEAFKYRFANRTRTNSRFQGYRQNWVYLLVRQRRRLRDLIRGRQSHAKSPAIAVSTTS